MFWDAGFCSSTTFGSPLVFFRRGSLALALGIDPWGITRISCNLQVNRFFRGFLMEFLSLSQSLQVTCVQSSHPSCLRGASLAPATKTALGPPPLLRMSHTTTHFTFSLNLYFSLPPFGPDLYQQADTQVVRSGDRPLDDDFFTAFERLEQVGPILGTQYQILASARCVLMRAICPAPSTAWQLFAVRGPAAHSEAQYQRPANLWGRILRAWTLSAAQIEAFQSIRKNSRSTSCTRRQRSWR